MAGELNLASVIGQLWSHCKADGTGFVTMPHLTQDVLIRLICV
jgi:hypothetical protein